MANLNDISHTFENGVTVVNTTPHPLNFQDSVSGETVVIPTSVPEGERTGDFVVNAGSNEVDLGGGLVTTEFVPSEEGMERIEQIKEWANDEGKDVRIVGSMIAAQAYPMEVVGMVAAPGFERVPPQDKLMSVEKFTAFQGDDKNDVTNDKIAELEAKIAELEGKLEESESVEKIEDDDLSVDIEIPDPIENEPLDENIVGDSSEEMEGRDIKNEIDEKIEEIKELIQDQRSEYSNIDNYGFGESVEEDKEIAEEIVKEIDGIEEKFDELIEKMENNPDISDAIIIDNLDHIKEEIKEDGYEALDKTVNTLEGTLYEMQLEKDEQKIEQIKEDKIEVEDITARTDAEEKEYSSPSLSSILKEEGFDVKEAWESVLIETDDGREILVDGNDEEYTVMELADVDGNEFIPVIDDDGEEKKTVCTNIDEVIEAVNYYIGDDKVDEDEEDITKDDTEDITDDNTSDDDYDPPCD